jgi:hypothetical protein
VRLVNSALRLGSATRAGLLKPAGVLEPFRDTGNEPVLSHSLRREDMTRTASPVGKSTSGASLLLTAREGGGGGGRQRVASPRILYNPQHV